MLTLLCDGVFLTRMELRKDPITRSWVITGDDVADQTPRAEAGCQFCPDSSTSSQQITSMAGIDGDPWSARAVVHPNPLYRIEGEPARRGEGISTACDPSARMKFCLRIRVTIGIFGLPAMPRSSNSCCWLRSVFRI